MVGGHELTFLFTDIEGSTRLWGRSPVAMAAAVQRQEALLRATVERNGGTVFKTVGDGVYAVFDRPDDAVRAAISAQRALLAEPWSGFEEGDAIRVRIGVHTGPAEARDDDYFGPPLNRLSRTLAAGHGGQILCTDDTLAACAGMWPEGIEPRDLGERTLRDVPGSGRIFQLIAEGLPEHFPPLATLDPRVHNLPRWSSPSIGRETELARIRGLVRSRSARLITVLGTGGVGKTRLVTEAAAPLLDEFQDGIRFVDLSAVRDDTQVIPAIVQATGAADQLLDPRDALLEWLHARTLLLVLDNCEQVIEGVAAICHAILDAAPGVAILATSRVPIRIRGERQISLEPLDVEGVLDAGQPAVRLFTERATEVSPDFALDPEATEAVADICRLVDGLPLAIELAAAWVRILSPDALRRRLQESRAMLRDGARDLPDRQRALATTIAWSYELLEPDDQRAFRRLAVFRGGIAVDAAAAVIWEEPVSDPLWALTRLDALVQANLLQVATDPAGEPRFTMLQTIQEFATGILHASGEWDDASAAHAEFFATLAEEADEHYRLSDAARWLGRLDQEFANFDAVVAHCSSSEHKAHQQRGLEMVIALWEFLDQHGHELEARTWLAQLYDDNPEIDARLRARALLLLGNSWIFNPDRAREFYLQAANAAREADDPNLEHSIEGALGLVALGQGDFSRGVDIIESIVAWERESHDLERLGYALIQLGHAYCLAMQFDLALRATQEATTLLFDPTSLAWADLISGRVLRRIGKAEAAFDRLERGRQRFVEVNSRSDEARCLYEQSMILMRTDPMRAQNLIAVANDGLSENEDPYDVASAIDCNAFLLYASRSFPPAVMLLASARQWREAIGSTISPFDQTERDLLSEGLRIALGTHGFEHYDAVGRELSLRAAIELARTHVGITLTSFV